MTDEKPDTGDPTESTDLSPAPPDPQTPDAAAEEVTGEPDADAVDPGSDSVPEGATEPDADTPATDSAADLDPAAESSAGPAAEVGAEADADAETDAETDADLEADAETDADPEADADGGNESDAAQSIEAADTDVAAVAGAGVAGAAWTTTPVAPDPEATEAALAALAAGPEVTLEPPDGPPPPPPPGDEPQDEGTPILLVGGILVGAFIVALAIVLILFRPFDSGGNAIPSPSPITTEAPSASPSAITFVDTPEFIGGTLEEAELKAGDYGLVVRANPVEDDKVSPNTVIDQDPGPGESVEVGTTIELSVAVPVPTHPVPDVVNMSQADAIDAIEEAGLAVGDISNETSDKIVAGNVIDTDPAVATELPLGSSIDLVVSTGPAQVAVPDLVDSPEADVAAALDAVGLVAGDRTEAADESIVAGNVISTDPSAASEVDPGSAVAYVVSTGPAQVAVPDLVDSPEADVAAALDAVGLVAGDRTEAADESIVAGNVISTDPSAASEVDPGSAVAYVVSTGPAQVAVPDLVDSPEADVAAALDAVGLVAGDRTEAADESIVAGNVISTDPSAASEVDPGSAVAYVVSTGPAQVAVPDLVDSPEADVAAALDAVGLVAGDRTEAADESIVAGNVISTDPSAASEVDPGSAVAYVVSTGPAQVAVPDLVDSPEADVAAALDAVGLVAGDRTEAADESIVAGNVISTDPSAASEVDPGSAVAYVVSTGPAQVAVPDLVDSPEADVAAALDAVGLVAGDRTEAADESIVAGNVISTDPSAASEVDPGSAVAYVVSTGPAQVAVPDLVDSPEADVAAALDAVGLVAGDRTEAADESIVAGNVISTDPSAASEVDPGSAVAYVVSTGPAQVAVPDLVDSPEADVAAALDAVGLVAGDRTEAADESIVAGNVISTDPSAASEVDPGSAVAYVVSTGPAQVAVPDLVDSPEADVAAALDAVGLVAGDRTEAADESIVAGNVISTDPSAASEVDPGSAVAYVVSTGPAQVAVPDLVDSPEADVAAALDAVGLVAGDRTEAADESIVAGNVISTDPSAASEVDPGSAVAYVVSTGPAQVAVPDLVDSPEADVAAALDAVGLVAGDRTEAADESIVAGNVISTDPSAASEVDPGSAVAYVVSTGPAQVAVPDLVDSPEADVAAALDAVGLVAGDRTEAADESIVAGNVISTDPSAASEVDPGSAVAYVVSTGPAQVAVPDLVDSPEADVAAALDAVGLVAGDRTEAADESIVAGNVISTDPSAASEVDPGSAVAYVVSTGPAQVAVPDLVDSPEADVAAALDAVGLVAGDRTEAADESIVAGNVISTDPSAASEVDPGSAVAYVVSTGPAQVAVPDLVDSPEADVAAALDAVGLVAGDRTEAADESIVAGNVISTDPSAASEVDPGSAVAYVVSTGPAQVAVPDLVDSPEADVAAALDAVGLVAGDRTEAADESIVAGNVISTDPSAASEVDPGSAVAYVVSTGPAQVAVPDLVDSPEADVAAALDAVGLVAGDRTEAADESIVAGNVISTDPSAASEVDPGSAVAYVVSTGPAQVAVPDLVDSPEADVAAALDAVGLVAGDRTEAADESIVAGNVISTDPSAASEVDPGSAVAYVVSTGPAQVAVPDLVDSPEADVAAALDAVGLVAGDRTEAADESIVAGNVISTDPSAASEVDPGSAVAYVVSTGPAQVAVPDLVDSPEADVAAALDAVGLVAGDRTEAADESIVAGNVISTDPSAASEVDPGSAVAYVVSTGPAQVAVPDLVDSPEADVAAALDAVGLVAGDRTEAADESIVAGNVISTDPSAASEVDPGSAVAYVVSTGPAQVAVPDLVDSPEADVAAALDAVGLVAGDRTEAADESIVAGNVISTDPSAASEVDPGSAVAYVVSTGPAQVETPDVRGMSLEDAQAEAELSRLIMQTTDVETNDVPPDTIVSQDPVGGTLVDVGSTIVVSVAVAIPPVAVPDVRNLAETDAIGAIQSAGLSVEQVDERTNATVPAGEAVRTEPAAGEMLEVGSSVVLVMSKGPKQVEVPDITGLSEDDAIGALQGAELTAGEATQQFSDAVAAGDVISSDPAAGATVDAASTVDYVVSQGVEQVEVPDLSGPAADADQTLIDAGLVGSSSADFSGSVPVGEVISQTPAAGDIVDIGSSVDYVVSQGVEQVNVPDLSGPAADADQTLIDAGLVGSSTADFSETVPDGDVISQDPAAGEPVDIGSTVDYVVSQGPTPIVTVPNVRDVPQGDAVASIEAEGLVVGETVEQFHEKVAAGNAIKTDPAADSEVPIGSAVTLYVSSGPATVTIPEVKDTPAADAQATLEAEGLVVSTEERTNSKIAAGNAVKTDPAAGTDVEAGATVSLIVSKGPKPATVPDIVGLPRGQATSAITDAKLSVGAETVVADPSPKNTVLSQDPPAAAEVPEGTAVDYSISSGPATVTIPEVKDTPAADAQATLEAEGLVVSTEERTNSKIAAGNAVKTDPAAGTDVEAGATVSLIVSKGPKPATVPDIVGLPRGQATSAITDAKLSVGAETVVADPSPKNTVLSQDPPAAAEVPEGTAVDYSISSGPATVTIPEVKDTPAADAQATLEAEGLVVSTEERTNSKIAAGNAVKTDPAAGTDVEAGATVSLIVSKGPKPATVPDIVGLPRGQATSAITDAKLSVGAETVVADPSPKNTVLSQDPPAAAEVPEGTAVDYSISSGPATVTIPEVKDTPAADAQATLEAEGLVVSTEERTNSKIAAGNAVKTDPAAGTDVEAGATVSLIVSKGPKPATVPDIVGMPEADAISALQAANLVPGTPTEVIDESVPAGQVIAQDPNSGTSVPQGTTVDYTISAGASVEPRGAGGSLDNPTLSAQLDEVASTVPDIRQLALGNTPYDGANRAAQESLLSERSAVMYDPSTLGQEQEALARMGLLGSGDDLAALLDELYGQSLPIAYIEQRGRQSILQSIDKFSVAQRAEAAREFGRAATSQAFGSDAIGVGDATNGDQALAGVALQQGDGTVVMLDWSAANVGSNNQAKVDDVVVPGSDSILSSMPQLLQREYTFPFLEGRNFVDQVKGGDWANVDDAWSQPPESTEQVMHPNKYRSDRPTSIDLDGVAGQLGGGWSERWQQTMGELRIGVWLADGQPGSQQGPKAPVKLPKANAAAGWGGDRLVSLDGPDGSWAIVWQTKWDTSEDVGQFIKAANAAVADLSGAHAVVQADVSGGLSDPALVLLASDDASLSQVAAALGVDVGAGGS